MTIKDTRNVHPRILRQPFDAAGTAAAARALRDGEVMSYPTETSYALGGNALQRELVERVFRLKGRAPEKAILLLVDGSRGLAGFAREVPPAAAALMAAFWPGPLTMVFRAARGLPGHLCDEWGTVALRWCGHPAVAELLRIGGMPLIGTSANISGRPAARTSQEVLETFGEGVRLAVDGGETPGGPPSTLLDTTTRPFQLAREGVIPAQALRVALLDEFPGSAPLLDAEGATHSAPG